MDKDECILLPGNGCVTWTLSNQLDYVVFSKMQYAWASSDKTLNCRKTRRMPNCKGGISCLAAAAKLFIDFQAMLSWFS